MRNYLVFMPDGKERVEEEFPDAAYELADDLWAVGSPLLTSAEVCNALGVGDSRTMVVVPMNDYYGRYDRALWQRLEAWSQR